MNAAVLIPVKGFGSAKQRLGSVLAPHERERLACWMAERVLGAVAEMAVFVACDDPGVREWAESRGATVLWGPGLGLNGAVDDGVARIAADGFDHVVVAHSDLPFPAGLVSVARAGTTTLVPDRRRDGTNVMAFPVSTPLDATYGPGSFSRHLDAARQDHGRRIEVRTDAQLSLDIDTPSDLAHPMTSEVLPAWLPTIPANHFTHAR